jgi:hypothetical protein
LGCIALSVKGEIPKIYIEEFFMARRKLIERLKEVGDPDALKDELAKNASLISPMVATYGPAGINVSPFMLTFFVKEEYLSTVLDGLRYFTERYWRKGERAFVEACELLLDTVYDLNVADPLRLVTHIMTKGDTWINLKATGEASIGILLPPDRGALELRARAYIFTEGPVYEYTNLVHDIIHVVPKGERSHPWYPAVLFEVEEIYDNSYQALGKRLYRSPS